MRILIIGCGYVGLPLGSRLLDDSHEVFGMRRSTDVEAELRGRGIQPLTGDVTRPESLAKITPSFDAVVNLVSSTRGSLEDYQSVYLEGTRNVLEWLRGCPPKTYIYTSST